MQIVYANPIYDSVFKHLVEDIPIAKGLITRLLGCEVHSLVPHPHEITMLDTLSNMELENAAKGSKAVAAAPKKTPQADAPHQPCPFLGQDFQDQQDGGRVPLNPVAEPTIQPKSGFRRHHGSHGFARIDGCSKEAHVDDGPLRNGSPIW